MATKKTEKKQEYSAKDIYVLEGLDPVRKRPSSRFTLREMLITRCRTPQCWSPSVGHFG